MRNRYAGNCSLCGKFVPVKAGRWRMIGKMAQNFQGLRCLACSTTTKAHKKHFEKVLGREMTHNEYKFSVIHAPQKINIIRRRQQYENQ